MYTSINSSAPQDRETRPLKATSCSTPISLRYTHQPEIPPLVRFGSQGVLGLFSQFPFFSLPPSGLWALSLMTPDKFPKARKLSE